MLALLKLFVVGLGCEYQGAMGAASAAASPVNADPWACACLPQVDLMGPGAKFYRRLAADVTPTFEVAHRTLYGKPSTQSVYTEWKNCAGKKPSTSYTHTNINQSFADWIVREIQPRFVVEVGSFTGLSSVRFGKALVNAGLRQRSFLLCIDTWLGDLNMLLNKRDFAASLSWRAGEPELYDQWVAHIVAAGLQDVVLPLRQTSLLGARFLKAVRWQADLVFLDSAHEVDETFAELVLFWDPSGPEASSWATTTSGAPCGTMSESSSTSSGCHWSGRVSSCGTSGSLRNGAGPKGSSAGASGTTGRTRTSSRSTAPRPSSTAPNWKLNTHRRRRWPRTRNDAHTVCTMR